MRDLQVHIKELKEGKGILSMNMVATTSINKKIQPPKPELKIITNQHVMQYESSLS